MGEGVSLSLSPGKGFSALTSFCQRFLFPLQGNMCALVGATCWILGSKSMASVPGHWEATVNRGFLFLESSEFAIWLVGEC